MTTPDEIARQIIRAAQSGDGDINVMAYADTLASYLTTRRNERKLKSSKRNAEKASRKKSRLKSIKHNVSQT